MNQRLLTILFIGFFLSVISIAIAETVLTVVHFNVGSTVAFLVTLPGQSDVESNGASSTADIYFNCTDSSGNCVDLEPCLTGGSNCQNVSNSTSIFVYDNIGTVNLNMGIYFNATLPSCVSISGNTVNNCAGTNIADSQVTINSSFTPADSNIDYYLCADFTDCTAMDDETRQITHNGTQV